MCRSLQCQDLRAFADGNPTNVGDGTSTLQTRSGWREGRASRRPDRQGGRWESGAARTRDANTSGMETRRYVFAATGIGTLREGVAGVLEAGQHAVSTQYHHNIVDAGAVP
jgi:hypothetical protein